MRPPIEAALLFIQSPDLLAKLGFQNADHLGSRTLAKLRRQIAASGKLLFESLFLPISVHEHRMSGKGKRFKTATNDFKLGH